MSENAPPCPCCGRARKCYGHWRPTADELCGYCNMAERQRGNRYAIGHGAPGVPVYDEAGALFAQSVSAAGRALGLKSTAGLYDRHIEDYRDGYRLTSRPNPANVGRRGGRKVRSS